MKKILGFFCAIGTGMFGIAFAGGRTMSSELAWGLGLGGILCGAVAQAIDPELGKLGRWIAFFCWLLGAFVLFR